MRMHLGPQRWVLMSRCSCALEDETVAWKEEGEWGDPSANPLYSSVSWYTGNAIDDNSRWYAPPREERPRNHAVRK